MLDNLSENQLNEDYYYPYENNITTLSPTDANPSESMKF